MKFKSQKWQFHKVQLNEFNDLYEMGNFFEKVSFVKQTHNIA